MTDSIERRIKAFGPRKDMEDPRTIEDTGKQGPCVHCGHLRSEVDGADQCLLCVVYLYMKESSLQELKPCFWCLEPTTERAKDRNIGPIHWECNLRMLFGGLNHLKRTCTCYGGPDDDPDPPGLTRREAAKRAAQFFLEEK